MNMMQQETGDQKESGYGNLDVEIPTDDEEVTIPPHDIFYWSRWKTANYS